MKKEKSSEKISLEIAEMRENLAALQERLKNTQQERDALHLKNIRLRAMNATSAHQPKAIQAGRSHVENLDKEIGLIKESITFCETEIKKMENEYHKATYRELGIKPVVIDPREPIKKGGVRCTLVGKDEVPEIEAHPERFTVHDVRKWERQKKVDSMQ
jgi:predicted nuclease with TOPRIM domain